MMKRNSAGRQKEVYMKKLYVKMMSMASGLQRRAREVLNNDEGMGTVEVILIILEIFTHRWLLMRSFLGIGNKAQMNID